MQQPFTGDYDAWQCVVLAPSNADQINGVTLILLPATHSISVTAQEQRQRMGAVHRFVASATFAHVHKDRLKAFIMTHQSHGASAC